MNNELIGWYLNKSRGERVDFLYMNYPRLKRIMKGYQDSLYMAEVKRFVSGYP